MTKRNFEESEPGQESKLKKKSKGMTEIHKHEETKNTNQKKDRSTKHKDKRAKTVVEKEIRKPATMQSLLNDKLQKAKAYRLEHSSKVQGSLVKNSDSKIDADKSVTDQSGLIDQVKEKVRSDRFTDEHKSKNDEIPKSVGLSTSKIHKLKANTEISENQVEKNVGNKRKKRKDVKADESFAQGNKEDIRFETEDDSTLKKSTKRQKKEKQKDSGEDHDSQKHTSAGEIDNVNEENDPEKAALRKKKREKRKLKKLEKERKKNENKDKAGTAKLAAVEYLKQWKNEREEWKFQKVRQVWLLQNMYDQALLDDDSFDVLLEYLEGLKGHSREKTVSDAETMLAKSEKEEAEMQFERAKQIIQLLSDS